MPNHPAPRPTAPARAALRLVFALLAATGTPAHAASHRIPLPTTHNAIPGADGDTTDYRLSHDGTRELFRTAAANLVPGMAAGRVRLVLREGDTLRALAPGLGGAAPNADVLAVALSGDGEYAVFLSRASNLVAGDSGISLDLFRLHLDSGTLQRFAPTQGAGLADGDRIELNRDGSRACLVTPAPLVPADTAGYVDAYLLNFDPPLVRRMSDAANNANGNGHVVGSCRFGAETDGSSNAVVFASAASNLVAGDTNAHVDVFLRSTAMNAPFRISLTDTGAQTTGGANDEPWLIAADGARLLFWRSCATDVVPDRSHAVCDIVRRDIDNGDTLVLSRATSGAANGSSDRLVVSPDGRLAAFRSRAGNLATNRAVRANAVALAFEGPDRASLFVQVHADPDATLLPTAIAVLQDELESHRFAYLSNAVDAAHGKKTAVSLGYSEDVTPDGNGLSSRNHRLRTQGTHASLRRAGADGDILGLAASGDGRTLAFYALAANLDAGPPNPVADLYLLDLRTGALQAPVASDDPFAQPTVDTHPPAIAFDGARIAFAGDGLLPADNRLGRSVYLWQRDAALTLVSRNADGSTLDGNSGEPAMDAVGARVVFTSDASNALSDDAEFLRHRHVYLHDVATGTNTRLSHRFNEVDGDSFDPQISADGSLVTFCSRANDLVDGDTHPGADLFVYDVATAALTRIDQGAGQTCRARLAPSGELAVSNGVFLDPRTGANPDAVGPLELGPRPVTDFSGRIVAGIEVLTGPGIDGLVKVKRMLGPAAQIAPIGPRATPLAELARRQGEVVLSHDGRTLFLTSRAALDPQAPGTTSMRHLYRHLPFDVFFDGLED